MVDGERRALRIDAHGDPTAPRNFHRAVHHLAAVLFDLLAGGYTIDMAIPLLKDVPIA